MSDVAREARLPVGRDVIDNLDSAEHISKISRGRFAPDAIYSIFQDMVKFLHFERSLRTMDTYITESRMVTGPGFPGAFVSVTCMQNAALAENEKTLVLASLGKALAFPQASAQMRRLFGPCGYASRQDVIVAQDMDTASEGEDFEAWVA